MTRIFSVDPASTVTSNISYEVATPDIYVAGTSVFFECYQKVESDKVKVLCKSSGDLSQSVIQMTSVPWTIDDQTIISTSGNLLFVVNSDGKVYKLDAASAISDSNPSLMVDLIQESNFSFNSPAIKQFNVLNSTDNFLLIAFAVGSDDCSGMGFGQCADTHLSAINKTSNSFSDIIVENNTNHNQATFSAYEIGSIGDVMLLTQTYQGDSNGYYYTDAGGGESSGDRAIEVIMNASNNSSSVKYLGADASGNGIDSLGFAPYLFDNGLGQGPELYVRLSAVNANNGPAVAFSADGSYRDVTTAGQEENYIGGFASIGTDLFLYGGELSSPNYSGIWKNPTGVPVKSDGSDNNTKIDGGLTSPDGTNPVRYVFDMVASGNNLYYIASTSTADGQYLGKALIKYNNTTKAMSTIISNIETDSVNHRLNLTNIISFK